MATPPAATTPPDVPTAQPCCALRPVPGLRRHSTASAPVLCGIFGLAASETVDPSCWAGARVRLGTDGVTPSVSASAPALCKHLNRVAPETATNVGPLTPSGAGVESFPGNSPSVALCHRRKAATGRTIAHFTEAAGSPHSILTQKRQAQVDVCPPRPAQLKPRIGSARLRRRLARRTRQGRGKRKFIFCAYCGRMGL
jgi:hypothetical protein